jgi:hypothetical protein
MRFAAWTSVALLLGSCGECLPSLCHSTVSVRYVWGAVAGEYVLGVKTESSSPLRLVCPMETGDVRLDGVAVTVSCDPQGFRLSSPELPKRGLSAGVLSGREGTPETRPVRTVRTVTSSKDSCQECWSQDALLDAS